MVHLEGGGGTQDPIKQTKECSKDKGKTSDGKGEKAPDQGNNSVNACNREGLSLLEGCSKTYCR